MGVIGAQQMAGSLRIHGWPASRSCLVLTDSARAAGVIAFVAGLPAVAGRQASESWSQWPGLNRRPTVYETVALPLSYIGLTGRGHGLVSPPGEEPRHHRVNPRPGGFRPGRNAPAELEPPEIKRTVFWNISRPWQADSRRVRAAGTPRRGGKRSSGEARTIRLLAPAATGAVKRFPRRSERRIGQIGARTGNHAACYFGDF
jgi:hypothetical protein